MRLYVVNHNDIEKSAYATSHYVPMGLALHDISLGLKKLDVLGETGIGLEFLGILGDALEVCIEEAGPRWPLFLATCNKVFR